MSRGRRSGSGKGRLGSGGSLDLLVRGGLVFDGLGSPPSRADVGIKDGRVAAVGPSLPGSAREVVDASGLWLTPGFLDIHTHYDIELEIAPGLSESVRHGVTSVVMGNCSLSLTVGSPETLADIFLRVESIPSVLVRRWLKSAVAWDGPEGYLDHLGRLPAGPNVAPLLGHSALRAEAMGLERSLSERATAEDLRRMRRLASRCLDAGCIGISADMVPWHMMSGRRAGDPRRLAGVYGGRAYPASRTIPSQHADFREYAMLGEVCRERDAVFQVSPNPHDLRSMIDILRLAVGPARAPLRITVLAALDSVSQRALWRTFAPFLAVVNGPWGGNMRFQTLTEPFTVYSDGPLTPLFEEFQAGSLLNDQPSEDERRRLWADPAFREDFRRQWTSRRRRAFHRDLEGMVVVEAPDPALVGLSVAESARRAGRDPVGFFMDLLERHDERLRWVSTGANDREEQRRRLMALDHVLPGFTDAGAHVRSLGFYDGALSLLKQAVQTGFMTPERAVQRVTGEPASWFRLDAGTLRPGAAADLVLLDPAGLKEPISGQAAIPDPLLEGARRMVKRGTESAVRGVYIGGRLAWRDGRPSAALGRERLGRLLGLVLEVGPEAGETRRRNRVSDALVEHPFRDYWEVFVLKHQDPRNVAMHMLGVAVFYGVLAAAWALGNPWWLLATPLSQLSGLLGHWLFEWNYIDARDAVFSVRASWCLNKMFLRVLTGRYWDELRDLKRRLAEHQARGAFSDAARARPGATPPSEGPVSTVAMTAGAPGPAR